MPYSADDLKVIDPIDAIRDNPELFTGAKKPTAELLVSRLISDILVDDSRIVSVARVCDWWIVASDIDWIEVAAFSSVLEYFNRVIPFPEAGRNSIHCGVILSAFTCDLVTFSAERKTLVHGEADTLNDDLTSRFPAWGRCVAFRTGHHTEECA